MESDETSWRGRSPNRVPFGLRDGRLHFVADVPTGRACGCVCPDPSCNQPLIARNRDFPGRKRAYYFTHTGTPAGCAGRESALHRMAKQVIFQTRTLTVPAWRGAGTHIPDAVVALLDNAAVEVTLLAGQVRPDVQVAARWEDVPIDPLFVEIRVTHAVDALKAQRIRAGRLNMLEIDLSEVDDEQLVDASAFAQLVLHDSSIRRWIHLDAPEYLAVRLGVDVYDVPAVETFRHDVPTRTGNTMHFTKQRLTRYREREAPVLTDIELADTYRPDGQRVDGGGHLLPYSPGLYVRNWDVRGAAYWDRGAHFKTHLTPLRMDEAELQPGLF